MTRIDRESGVIDTHPLIKERQIAGYRNMSAATKLNSMGRMYEFAVRMAMNDVRRQYPDIDEQECRLRAASRWLDPELLRKAYGWTPEKRD
jgi:hypothetical protein